MAIFIQINISSEKTLTNTLLLVIVLVTAYMERLQVLVNLPSGRRRGIKFSDATTTLESRLNRRWLYVVYRKFAKTLDLEKCLFFWEADRPESTHKAINSKQEHTAPKTQHLSVVPFPTIRFYLFGLELLRK